MLGDRAVMEAPAKSTASRAALALGPSFAGRLGGAKAGRPPPDERSGRLSITRDGARSGSRHGSTITRSVRVRPRVWKRAK